jgi:diacylglycerol kinase family enzyme
MGDVRELIAGLKAARRVRFDVGRARGPWGKKFFFEGFGLGLFTDVMTALDARKEREPETFQRADDPLALAVRALMDALGDYGAHDLRLSLDGEDLSGRYLLVEAMNIRHIGPNLFLAPDADPGDGLLDFVLLTEDRRGEFGEYLNYRLEGKQEAPCLSVRRGRLLEFAWVGATLRFDDKTWPKQAAKRKKMLRRVRERARRGDPAAVEINLKVGGVEFLIPRR